MYEPQTTLILFVSNNSQLESLTFVQKGIFLEYKELDSSYISSPPLNCAILRACNSIYALITKLS